MGAILLVDHSRTPTPLPPAPRRVRARRLTPFFGVWFGRLFILPHTLIGIGMLLYFLFRVLHALFGWETEAQVTGVHTYQSKKSGMTYYVDYAYRIGLEQYKESTSIPREQYEQYQRMAEGRAGDAKGADKAAANLGTVRVRVFNLGPFHHAGMEGTGAAWYGAGGVALFALFWNGVVSVFVYMLWVRPLRERWLIRTGMAATGTITQKHVVRGKSTSYYVRFHFQNPLTLGELERKQECIDSAAWNSVEEGQAVTVLCSPRKPKRAIVYECSAYHVPGAGGRDPAQAGTIVPSRL